MRSEGKGVIKLVRGLNIEDATVRTSVLRYQREEQLWAARDAVIDLALACDSILDVTFSTTRTLSRILRRRTERRLWKLAQAALDLGVAPHVVLDAADCSAALSRLTGEGRKAAAMRAVAVKSPGTRRRHAG